MLDGEDPAAHEGQTFLLVTAPPDAWPHVAMLSVGEVFAPGEDEIRLALWPGSQTTKNLTAEGRGLLMVIASGAAYYVRLRCRRLADASVREKPRAVFSGQVDEVLQDVVDYAEITSGIRFRLPDRERVLAAWAESVAMMRSRTT